MPFDEPIECPLCMEPLDIDDLNFYPCTCGYQICRFCWHRIRTDENSLCPACRKQYQEDPAEFKPLTEEELSKIKKERRQKDAASRQKAAENRRHLANIRVVQKTLVFVVGLSTRLADTEVLKRQDYFGKYGKILKVVINSSTSYAGAQGPSASAYITYTKPEDCLRAIHAVNNLYVDGRTLKASLGTTKYCSHFLKGTQCNKTDCMYLHELGDEEASFTKEEMQSGKHQDYEQKLVDTYLTTSNMPSTSSTHPTGRTSSGDSLSTTGAPNTSKQTASHRKKTDSGSSNGSSKLKEPWPLLNSNRNSNQSSQSSNKDEVCPAVGDNTTSDISSHSVVSSVQSSTSTAPLHNGTNHSSPSSTYSASSNPRTPTPETQLAASNGHPRLSSAMAAVDRSSPVVTSSSDTAASSRSSLTARKQLPFSDPSEPLQSANEEHGMHKMYPSTIGDSVKPLSGANISSQAHVSALGFAKANEELLPSTSSDWLSPTDQLTAASDDDLGFDPFLESNKGLQDLLENETGHGLSLLPSFRPSGGLGLPLSHHRPPPGVAARRNLMGTGEMLSGGILPSIVTPSSQSVLPSAIVCTNSSTLPPPPPGLSAFPQYPNDAPSTASLNGSTGQDVPPFRGSRMLSLMNLGPSSSVNMSPTHHLIGQSPAVPRSPYNDSRLGSVQGQHGQPPYTGFTNGVSDSSSSFNTQDIHDSLKALLPNASINVLPTSQTLQHSRLRNSYMQPGTMPSQNGSSAWNSNNSQKMQHTGTSSGGAIDDQFTDPAIVSGCLSATDSNSPPPVQPHWLTSIHQLTEVDSPVKPTPGHPMSSVPSAYNRQSPAHSRMPFAQNMLMGQPGSNNGGWPTYQPHNPPPGFTSTFRSSSQNPHMAATLES